MNYETLKAKEIMERAGELLKENKGKHSVANAIYTIVIEFNINYPTAVKIVNTVK